MTATEPSLSEGRSEAPEPGQRRTPRTGAWLPTWDLITTKNLEIRKRRGLMITMVVLIVVPTVLFYGLRLLFHAVDPHTYAPAGSPGMFSGATNLTDEFGFIAAAALGAAASRWTSCARPRWPPRQAEAAAAARAPATFCSAGREPSASRRCRPGR